MGAEEEHAGESDPMANTYGGVPRAEEATGQSVDWPWDTKDPGEVLSGTDDEIATQFAANVLKARENVGLEGAGRMQWARERAESDLKTYDNLSPEAKALVDNKLETMQNQSPEQ